MAAEYTVYWTGSPKSDKRKGAFHYSDDCYHTLCGKYVDEKWFICNNMFTGKATCPECIKIDRKRQK